MLTADTLICSNTNPVKGSVFNSANSNSVVDSCSISTLKGLDITPQAIIRFFEGISFSLDSDDRVLIWITGHGGWKYLRVHDGWTMNEQEIRNSIEAVCSHASSVLNWKIVGQT
ncbi:hypothetical protein PCE1_000232 [Barthelona sp. PCE]